MFRDSRDVRLGLAAVLAQCALAVGALTFGAGCSNDAASGDDSPPAEDEIINGEYAMDYPEAAAIDFQMNTDSLNHLCSGTVIAPRVVLTAGHCVVDAHSWTVMSNGQTVSASQGTVYDYVSTVNTVDLTRHDVGLLFLDSPINLARYPTIARSPLPERAAVLNVGRMLNGAATYTLWSAPSQINHGAIYNAPLDYVSTQVTQQGDSGGPTFQLGTHSIVSVNSGIIGGVREYLARTDLLADWIAQQVAINGGSGNTIDFAGPTGAVPNDTLAAGGAYSIAAQELNCRLGPGTENAIQQRLFRGQVVNAAPGWAGMPRVAPSTEGKLWVLVQPGGSPPCYASAQFQFIQPF